MVVGGRGLRKASLIGIINVHRIDFFDRHRAIRRPAGGDAGLAVHEGASSSAGVSIVPGAGPCAYL